ncbi:hypothetical protein RYH80_15570 [Halobaculum sp. MBLA0147]|uniref:hypothetical protein n=1 Tax=Halobaculum sp. MBLA0147 TaxID=3079934 RepID=UPI0035267649
MFVGHEFVAFGVATLAAARVGRTRKTALTVDAVGAWFEVSEFLFETFWYDWTLQFYFVDTVTDRCVDALGALSTATVVVAAWSDETPHPRSRRDERLRRSERQTTASAVSATSLPARLTTRTA